MRCVREARRYDFASRATPCCRVMPPGSACAELDAPQVPPAYAGVFSHTAIDAAAAAFLRRVFTIAVMLRDSATMRRCCCRYARAAAIQMRRACVSAEAFITKRVMRAARCRCEDAMSCLLRA